MSEYLSSRSIPLALQAALVPTSFVPHLDTIGTLKVDAFEKCELMHFDLAFWV